MCWVWEDRVELAALQGSLHFLPDGERGSEGGHGGEEESCVIFLHPNHKVDKDNAKRICGLDSCARHHHPSLHGAKDPQVPASA